MSVQASRLQEAFSSEILNLILLPTERCNFRCTYCYEDFAAGQMKPAVVEAVKALTTSRAPELRSLEISWFGGEPLVAKPVVYELSEHFAALAGEYGHLSYTANMTTNGHLLDVATARRLVDLGVSSYQVTLDGPPDIHDRSRIRKNGNGTFWEIWSNLLAIHESDFDIEVMLRVHFMPDTYQLLDPLIEMINNALGTDRRFTVYFKSVDHLGGPHDEDMRVVPDNDKDGIKAWLDAKLIAREQVYDLSGDEEYICYASRPNSLVVRSTGDLAKCTVALYDPRNRVGRLNPDGTVDIDQRNLRLWLKGFASLDALELACPYTTMEGAFTEYRGQFDTSSLKRLPVLRSSG